MPSSTGTRDRRWSPPSRARRPRCGWVAHFDALFDYQVLALAAAGEQPSRARRRRCRSPGPPARPASGRTFRARTEPGPVRVHRCRSKDAPLSGRAAADHGLHHLQPSEYSRSTRSIFAAICKGIRADAIWMARSGRFSGEMWPRNARYSPRPRVERQEVRWQPVMNGRTHPAHRRHRPPLSVRDETSGCRGRRGRRTPGGQVEPACSVVTDGVSSARCRVALKRSTWKCSTSNAPA